MEPNRRLRQSRDFTQESENLQLGYVTAFQHFDGWAKTQGLGRMTAITLVVKCQQSKSAY